MQSVSTGYGQPPVTVYDSTLAFNTESSEHQSVVPLRLYARLKLEMISDRISRTIYGNHDANEHVTAFFDPKNPRASSIAIIEAERLKDETEYLKDKFSGEFICNSENATPADIIFIDIEWLYQKAVTLHLRLYSFFDTSSDASLRTDLLDLYYAATSFIDQALLLDADSRLAHAPNIIFQVLLAAGFALLKLLNSDYAGRYVTGAADGRKYFSNTVRMARAFSTKANDLPMRLCEVLAQLWKESGSGSSVSNASKANSPHAMVHTPFARQSSMDSMEDAVRLKIRSRMSMSVVFDSVWRWRETHTLDRLEVATLNNNPTNPDSSSNSTPPPGENRDAGHAGAVCVGQASLDPGVTLAPGMSAAQALNMPSGVMNGLANTAANSYEFFDPVSWVLDFDPPGGWNGGFGGFHDFVQ